MGRALIIGCGGVAGVVIHKCCQNSDVFEEIMIASRTKSKCDAIKMCIRDSGIVDPQPHIREMLHQFFDMSFVAVLFEYNDHFSSLLHNVINFK